VALLAAVLALVGPAPARADTTTPATAKVLSPTEVTVSWSAPSSPATSWVVAAALPDGSLAGRQTACGSCTSTTFDYLTPGTAYRFTVAGLGATTGTVWGNATATTPRAPLCSASAACVSVDTTSTADAATGIGLGLLRGLTPRTDPQRIDALNLQYERIGAWEEPAFASARRGGGDIDVVLSDGWNRYTIQQAGKLMNPWEDWDLYRQFVTGVVYWHIAHGLVPEYWEIQNEPEQTAWYKTTAADMGPTTERILEQFRVAHDAIRAQLPNAAIVGPSLGSFEPAANALIDMPRFLDFVVAKSLRFDVIAWHAMGGECAGLCDAGPRSIASQVASVRHLIAQRPALGHPELHINEFGGPATVADPGYAVGYFAALAHSSVDRAGSSCWPATYGDRSYDGCYYDPGTMDNLLMPDGSTPRAAWLVWQAYAQADGDVVATSASQPDLSVFGATTNDGTVKVLVGRHPATGRAAAPDPVLRIKVSPLASRVNVVVTTISATDAGATPTSRAYNNVKVSRGVVDLGSLHLPAGTAAVVDISGTGLLNSSLHGNPPGPLRGAR
jgi:hypothetical protein